MDASRFVLPTASALAIILAGCADLQVTNPNAPDAHRAVADAVTVESTVAGAFQDWFSGQYSYRGMGMPLAAISFQYATWACQASHFSTLPRSPEDPEKSIYNQYATYPWYKTYAALTSVAEGLRALDTRSELAEGLGESGRERIRAFGRFVQGLGHGTLALLYDRAIVLDETTDPYGDRGEPIGYQEMTAVALSYLHQAATLSQGRAWEIPADWMSVPVTGDQLARLAHSYAARLRAAVARTPAERAGVDWNAVLADVDAGITESWVMEMYWGWANDPLIYGSRPRSSNDPYFILGMADQSGSYQRWLNMPLDSRIPNPDTDGDGQEDPILIVSPDTRFPRGSTLEEQEANPGSLFVIPNGLQPDESGRWGPWDVRLGWQRPDRGPWRWSYYWHIDGLRYYYGLDFSWPEISMSEMLLLKAEGLLRQGNPGGAAELVNLTRTAAGLAPTNASGINTDCVPRLPDGSCGDLMEMLKWEKRLSVRFSGPFGAPWYFDARGWGDLYAGTFLHLPIPCNELVVGMGAECYTFGGPGGMGASPGSTYHWIGGG